MEAERDTYPVIRHGALLLLAPTRCSFRALLEDSSQPGEQSRLLVYGIILRIAARIVFTLLEVAIDFEDAG